MWVVKVIGWTALVTLGTTIAGVTLMLRRYETNNARLLTDLTTALAATY